MSNIIIRSSRALRVKTVIDFPYKDESGDNSELNNYSQPQYILKDGSINTWTTPIINNRITFFGICFYDTKTKKNSTTTCVAPAAPRDWQKPVFFILHDGDIVIASSKKDIKNWWKKNKIGCCKLKVL